MLVLRNPEKTDRRAVMHSHALAGVHNNPHLAIILLIEQSMSLLRDRRSGYHHLDDLSIFAALLTQILNNLQGPNATVSTTCM